MSVALLQRIICLKVRCAVVINDAVEAASGAKEECRRLIENDYFLLRFSSRILTMYFCPNFTLHPLLSLYHLRFFPPSICALLALLREQKFCWMYKCDVEAILQFCVCVSVCVCLCMCVCVYQEHL